MNSCPDGSVFFNNDCLNINECELWEPCRNNGVCVDKTPEEGGYYCQCVDNYEGEDCAILMQYTRLGASADFFIALIICIVVLMGKCLERW